MKLTWLVLPTPATFIIPHIKERYTMKVINRNKKGEIIDLEKITLSEELTREILRIRECKE